VETREYIFTDDVIDTWTWENFKELCGDALTRCTLDLDMGAAAIHLEGKFSRKRRKKQ
jgi:hypothetical protein